MRVIILAGKFETAFFKHFVCRDVIFVDNGFNTLYIKRDFFIYKVSYRIIKKVLLFFHRFVNNRFYRFGCIPFSPEFIEYKNFQYVFYFADTIVQLDRTDKFV